MYQLPPISASNILIYLRKSRSDDPAMTVEEVLEKHEAMLDEWVSAHIGGKVPEQNRFREVVSGETIVDRPEVQKLLSLIESPLYKAVLVVEPQRLSRGDLEDAGRIIKIMRYSGTIVLTLQYYYDLQDERDRDDFARELKRGNEFLEYQKRIMNRGRLASVEAGNYIGSKPPYGYDRISYKEGKRTCYTLAINEEQASVVRKIFALYLQGLGPVKISDILNSEGIPTQNGKAWRNYNVTTILINRHYTGVVKWNTRREKKTIIDGEVVVARPLSKEPLFFQGKHPPIISTGDFEDVQKRMGRNPRIKRGLDLTNPLSGLIFCQCGNRMNLRTYSKNGKERCKPRSVCYNQRNCHTPSALVEDLNVAIVNSLLKGLSNIEVTIKNGTADGADRSKAIKRLSKKIKELEDKEIKQWDEYLCGRMPREVFDKINSATVGEKESAQKALEEAQKKEVNIEKMKDFCLRLRKAIDLLSDETVSPKYKNVLLKSCVSKIVYSRSRTSGHQQISPIFVDTFLSI